jgi:hypothetical protein
MTVGNQVEAAMPRESDFPSKAGVGGFLAGFRQWKSILAFHDCGSCGATMSGSVKVSFWLT